MYAENTQFYTFRYAVTKFIEEMIIFQNPCYINLRFDENELSQTLIDLVNTHLLMSTLFFPRVHLGREFHTI